MQLCKFLCFLNSLSLPLNNSAVTHFQQPKLRFSYPKHPTPRLMPKTLTLFANNFPVCTHIGFSSPNDVSDDFQGTHLPREPQNDRIQKNEQLELQNKPSPVSPPISNESAEELDSELQKPVKDEALAPFLKFFKPRDSSSEEAIDIEDGDELEIRSDFGDKGKEEEVEDEAKKVNVEYYDPKPGDFVVGVVVSGNENKLDVNIGADLLGTMLTKEVLPLYEKEMEYLLCDLEDTEEFLVRGKMGIVKNEKAMSGGPVPGRPVVDTGTVLFAEVLGRTLSGRPLLSTRRLLRRYSWHRVRQIKHMNEPIEVKITEWNTGGLLTRIEGLRAFLPKAELVNRIYNFSQLKANVGSRIYVQITQVNEAKNELIVSEKEAWEMLYLQEGTLIDGTVRRIFTYGAEIRIGESNRSGLLHISKISRGRVTSVSDLLAVDEKVKVLVLKSMFRDKISLSIADLESEPGLFVSNKERVFSEAEEIAKKYREKLPATLASRSVDPLPASDLPFDNEASMYANWKWFKFERDNESN